MRFMVLLVCLVLSAVALTSAAPATGSNSMSEADSTKSSFRILGLYDTNGQDLDDEPPRLYREHPNKPTAEMTRRPSLSKRGNSPSTECFIGLGSDLADAGLDPMINCKDDDKKKKNSKD